MPNTKSAKRALRKSLRRRERNLRMINRAKKLLKALLKTTDVEEARALLPRVYSALDKLAKRNTFHPNKVARLKRRAMAHVHRLAQ